MWRRTRTPQPPNDTADSINVMVYINQESNQEGNPNTLHPQSARAPRQEHAPLSRALKAELSRQLSNISAYQETRIESETPFTRGALQRIAAHGRAAFQVVSDVADLIDIGESFDVVVAGRQIWRDMTEMLSLGDELFGQDNVADHASAINSDHPMVYTDHGTWMDDILSLLKVVDVPLYHIVGGSLYPHTPQHILERWLAFCEKEMRAKTCIPALIQQARRLGRKDWPLIILELYFLLLDHNQALLEGLPSMLIETDNLVNALSAYGLALRIRFYLWSMTHAEMPRTARKYRPKLQNEIFLSFYTELTDLAVLEFYRLHNLAVTEQHNAVRTLVGDPIDVDTIAKPLSTNEQTFCSICQETHAGADCVSPLNCDCQFGRHCLKPLLNRDHPSSYSCPNCRTQLHAPLEWQVEQGLDERNSQLGLLWALYADISALGTEMSEEFEPRVTRERPSSAELRSLMRVTELLREPPPGPRWVLASRDETTRPGGV